MSAHPTAQYHLMHRPNDVGNDDKLEAESCGAHQDNISFASDTPSD